MADELYSLLHQILNGVIGIAGGANWQTFGPESVQVAQTVTAGVTVFDPGGGIIPMADITPGTYTVDRIRTAAVVHVIPSTASSKADGSVFASYNFSVADGWLIGDLAIFTFSGIILNIGGVLTDLPPIQFWTRVSDEPDIDAQVTAINVNQGNPSGDHLISTTLKLGNDTASVAARFATILSNLGSPFSNTIQGNVDTALYKMLGDMATYFSVGGAAFSQTINPGSAARTSLDLAIKDLSDILAGAGITTYPSSATPANGVSIAQVISKIYQVMVIGFTALGGLTSDVIGVEWNQSTDSWRHIDESGNTIFPTAASFNSHPVWGGMRRCTMAPSGVVNHYGSNPRGDGLNLTGSDGRVMVEIPAFYIKSTSPSANVYRWWITSAVRPGYVLHPAFVQRGGVPQNYIYIGAYDADFFYNGANAAYNAANEQLYSRTGKQPYTGSSDCLFQVSFVNGAYEPNVGDVLSTPNGSGFIVAAYLKTSGAWSGTAAGILWVEKPGVAACGWLNNDLITNTTHSNTLGNTSGAPAGRNVTESSARTLAGNIGGQWGIMNVWSLSAIQLLFYTEYANANSQTLVGRGIVDKGVGTGYNGEVSGFNSADSNIAINGTGTGTGVDGLTPIVYRGIENLWGNIYQFVDGYDALDAAYHIINRNGLGTFANPMALGSYETSVAVPIQLNGYISNIVYEDLLAFLFIASAVAGSSSTYLDDYWYGHTAGSDNILLAGGDWGYGDGAGVACRNSTDDAGGTYRGIGARVEFIG